MDVYAVLRAEGEKLRKALAKLEDLTAGQPAERERLLDQVRARVEARRRLKEVLLFPLLASDPRTEGDVRESRGRDAEIARLFDELAGTPPDEPRFQPRAEALRGTIDVHLGWEEGELLSRAPAVIPDEQAEALGERASGEAEALEHELLRRPA